MSHERVFLEAEAEVAGAIEKAVALVDGDPARALGELLAWAEVGGVERRRTLFQSTRYRLQDDLPQLYGAVDQLVEEHGGDVDGACTAFEELRSEFENPTFRACLDKELAAAVEAAIVAWVKAECQRWRESHGR